MALSPINRHKLVLHCHGKTMSAPNRLIRQLFYRWLLIWGALTLIACAATPQKSTTAVSQDHPAALFYPSANQNQRIRFVIIHYTAGNWQQSLQALTKHSERPVSSHYLIPQTGDASYPIDKPLQIYQLVSEQHRAWHAGESSWQDRQQLNDQSIGIELVNESHCEFTPGISAVQVSEQLCLTPDFDPAQLLLLENLLQDILQRYPDITPDRVLAHSDVSPQKKQDPGARFPWQWLASRGIGAWYDAVDLNKFWQQPLLASERITQWQWALQRYGYGIDVTGVLDPQSQFVLLAFQRHFVPEQIDGQPNRKTLAVLTALLAKYQAKSLQQLQQTVIPVENNPVK
jgi:N-acetylmuramoyl-L-alanine amidase